MKRLILYVLILALVWLIPTERVDVAELRPVEVIAIYKKGNTVALATDTEDLGFGSDAVAALENMRSTSPAVIYLDTAEYLLVSPGAEEEVEHLRKELRENIELCTMDGKIDLKQAAQYLPVHGNLPSLRQWQVGEWLPMIVLENGRIKMSENHENDT